MKTITPLSLRPSVPLSLFPLFTIALLAVSLHAQTTPPPTTPDAAAQREATDAAELAQFDRRAALSKELGASHLVITDGLPLATWELDPTDPYPAWFVHHATLLKIFPPKDVQPYVNMEYATRVSGILEKRCEILKPRAVHRCTLCWSASPPCARLPPARWARTRRII